jgi:hypothetical protein
MRTAATLGLAALALLVAGRLLWTAGHLEAQLAAADRRMAALAYDSIGDTHAQIADALEAAWPLPGVTPGQRASLERQAVEARYWRGEYDVLRLARDEAGAVIERDVEVQFIKANAAYRRALSADTRAIVLAGLDEAVRQYGEVLRAAPGHLGAAYNYEFAARVRVALAGDRDDRLRPRDTDTDEAPPGDLPAGLTLHGRPGAPPAGTDMRQFQMVIPMSPDERRAVPERSGEGERPRRKG